MPKRLVRGMNARNVGDVLFFPTDAGARSSLPGRRCQAFRRCGIRVTGANSRARTRTRVDAAGAKSSQKNHLQARQLARTRGIAALAREFAPVTLYLQLRYWRAPWPRGKIFQSPRKENPSLKEGKSKPWGKENQSRWKENPNYLLPRIEPFQRVAPTPSQNNFFVASSPEKPTAPRDMIPPRDRHAASVPVPISPSSPSVSAAIEEPPLFWKLDCYIDNFWKVKILSRLLSRWLAVIRCPSGPPFPRHRASGRTPV